MVSQGFVDPKFTSTILYKKPISCFLPVGVLSHVLFGMKLFYSVRRSKANLSISMRKMW